MSSSRSSPVLPQLQLQLFMKGLMGSGASLLTWQPWCSVIVTLLHKKATDSLHFCGHRRFPVCEHQYFTETYKHTSTPPALMAALSRSFLNAEIIFCFGLSWVLFCGRMRKMVYSLLCGLHTIRNTTKIQVFEPLWGMAFSKNTLSVLFTAFFTIHMGQKIKAKNTFMQKTM